MSTPGFDLPSRHFSPRSNPGGGLLWLALALSAILHVAVLWEWRQILRTPSADESRIGEQSALHIRLAPPATSSAIEEQRRSQPAAPAVFPPVNPPAARERAAGEGAARPAAPAEHVLVAPAENTFAAPADVTQPRLPAASAAAPSAGATVGDLSAFIAARRRMRGELDPAPASAQEDQAASRQQSVAENLGLNAPQSFGYDPRRGGGVFQIQALEFDYCEFIFFGWRNDIRRNVKQLIEVRRANQPNIRIAVVRRMIEIIRDNEKGSFIWKSHRLGQNVTQYARQEDSSELENFLFREFFDPTSAAR